MGNLSKVRFTGVSWKKWDLILNSQKKPNSSIMPFSINDSLSMNTFMYIKGIFPIIRTQIQKKSWSGSGYIQMNFYETYSLIP